MDLSVLASWVGWQSVSPFGLRGDTLVGGLMVGASLEGKAR